MRNLKPVVFAGLLSLLVLLSVAVVASSNPVGALDEPWQPLAPPPGEAILAWSASPAYTTDHVLLAGTAAGLFHSAHPEVSWTPLGAGPAGPITNARKIVPAPGYPADPTLFVLAGTTGETDYAVWRSIDGGHSWQAVWQDGTARDLAISPGFAGDQTLFLGGVGPSGEQVLRSGDGGDTWQVVAAFTDTMPVSHLALSPAFAGDQTLFAAGFGPLQRSTDGGDTWQPLAAPGPNYGLAVSPSYGADHTLWVTYREIEGSGLQPESSVARSTDGGDTWTVTGAGLPGYYLTSYHDLVVQPDGQALYVALDSEFGEEFPSRVYRSDSGGLRWAPQPLLPEARRPGQLLAPAPLPDLFARADGDGYRYGSTCYEALADGGIETDPDLQGYSGVTRAWEIPSTPLPAGYAMDYKLQGAYSMRTGADADGPNVYSYSSFRQRLTIPADATEATLVFWRYPLLGDSEAVGRSPGLGAELFAAAPDTADFQYLLALFDDGSYRFLRTWRDNDRTWTETTVDLLSLAGRTFRLQFGTFNNGTGGPSGMFVDEATVGICQLAPATPPARAHYLPLIMHNLSIPGPTVTPTATPTATGTPTQTPTPTATPTDTPTPIPSVIPTATPGVWPTPYSITQFALPAGSHPHGIALNATGDRAYVAFHGVDHAGRSLGVLSTEPLGLLPTIDLAATATGPNQVALLPSTGRVVVTNRQTANAAVVDPVAGSVVQAISAGLLPDGIAVQDGSGYIANFGSNSVTLFDPATLAVTGTLTDVGQEPSLFGVDPTTGDVYLSAHGSNQVAILNGGTTVGHFNGVPEPYGLAFDPASRRLYVANRGTHHTVTVIDVDAGSTAGAIDVGQEPFVVAVNPDSGHLFVACGTVVKVYDTLDWSLVTSIPVPPGAEEGIAVDSLRDRVYVTSREGDAVTVIQDQGAPQVVFASDRDGNGELYRMLPDGRRQVRLTFTGDAWENEPAGSSDGRWIAYVRQGTMGPPKIWVMSRDGRNTHQVTFGAGNDASPTWSADSTRLAFASDRDGDWDIYALDLLTGAVGQLTDDPAEDMAPDWSWITGRIAFQSNRVGPNSEIFTMAADGSDVRRVTMNPNGDSQPSWSPLADRIAFWGTRDQQALYTVRADGSDVRLFVPQVLRPGSPAWAAVGETVAFSGFRQDSGYSEVMRVQADGSDLVLLTFNEVNFDYAPGWLPGR